MRTENLVRSGASRFPLDSRLITLPLQLQHFRHCLYVGPWSICDSNLRILRPHFVVKQSIITFSVITRSKQDGKKIYDHCGQFSGSAVQCLQAVRGILIYKGTCFCPKKRYRFLPNRYIWIISQKICNIHPITD